MKILVVILIDFQVFESHFEVNVMSLSFSAPLSKWHVLPPLPV